jgi:hypothetical protein
MMKLERTLPLLATLVIAVGLLAACGAETPTAQGQRVDTTAFQDRVYVVRADGSQQGLPSPQNAALSVGDGVDVDEVGRAILRFADLLTVDVVRNGDLQVQALDADEQSAVISVLQGAGAALYDYSPSTQAQKRLSVQAGAAVIVATGTQFLVVREADTPLDWVLAFDAAPNDLTVTASGVTQPVPSGMARWVAPTGEPSASIAFDAAKVVEWVRRARSGQVEPEIGEVLWPQADVVANTEPLDRLPATGAPFFLEGVPIELDADGLSGNPEYWLDDCNGDGIRDVAMRGGRLHMDFRPVLNRVRALDVTVLNWSHPGTAAVTALNPNRQPMGTRQVETSNDVVVVSLRSEPGRPYHFAQLDMREGCFLGFSLTPPGPSEQPGEPRPAVESIEPQRPSATPTLREQQPTDTPTRRPTMTLTPTRRPTATWTPTQLPKVCTVVSESLNMRTGPGTVYDIVERLARSARLVPLARNRAATWFYGQAERSGRKGWVAGDRQYVSCTFDLMALPERGTPPTPTPTATPTSPATRVLFEPQRAEITAGQCVTLRWQVDNARAVYLDGKGVAGYATREVCPRQTTTYRLTVDGYQGELERTATIVVAQAREPQVTFSLERWDTSCWTLVWDVEDAQAVYLDGNPVIGHDQRRVCPSSTTRYTLRVVSLSGEDFYHYQTITVGATARQAPAQLSPPDGSSFSHYPRTTTLEWSIVPDASYYRVEVDCFHCCASGYWCNDVGQTWLVKEATGTEFTFDHVGAQPGRWRVWAVYYDGSEGPQTGWWTFEYLR